MNKKFITSGLLVVVMVLAGAMSPYPAPNKALAVVDTFTASGSWVAPAGVTSVQVEVWGGGGAGGGQNLTSDGGGGGGGGAYSKLNTYTVVPGNSYSYTVGSGGTGVASATGNSGGDSYFINTSTLLAKGGTGGAPSTGTPPAGGAGGASASGVGDVKFSGGQGEKGRDNNTGLGGYGGSSGGTAANGYSGPQTYSTNVYPSASTPTGAGDGGDGGAASANGSAPASGNGGGGGGAGEGTAKVGGAGAVGKIVFTYTAPTTTLGDGTESGTTVTVGPGDPPTKISVFTLQTDTGTDTVTGMTITFTGNNPSPYADNVGVYTSGGVLKCEASTTSGSINLTGCGISVNTTPTEYTIKVTPKSHANMAAVPGNSTFFYTKVASITATNVTAGTDGYGPYFWIDNSSPSNVTNAGVGTNNTYNSIGWVNPTDSDFTTSGTVLVLRSTSAVTDTPVEGATYSVGNTIGSATVACVVTGSAPATTCQNTSLSNGTAYHYKVFTRDSHGNYSSGGALPAGSPASPTSTSKTIIITSGTSYVLPDDFDVTNNTIMAIGGGGGGGAGQGGASQARPAGGGGGGGSFAKITNFSAANPGDTVTIAIGTAGTAGAYPGGDAGAGGDTTFYNASTLKAAGGNAGLGATNASPGNGGAGGAGSVGSVTNTGGTGGAGGDSATSPGSGGGGAGAAWDGFSGGNGSAGVTGGGGQEGAGGRGGGPNGGIGTSSGCVSNCTGGTGTSTVSSDTGYLGGAGGGGSGRSSQGTGGKYGGGGGGGDGGTSGSGAGEAGAPGSQGVIIITYAPVAAAAPTVTTQSASSVTGTTATLNGNITARNGSNATVRGFAYGTSATLATVIATTTENGSFGTGAFTAGVSSLTCNITYYARAYATNTTGTGYGTIVSFTSPCAPTVTTQSASSIGQTSATLNGNITATGGANATVRGFAWGTGATLSGGDTATTTENGSFGTGAFTNSSLTLVCNTTYYSRAYATNPGGTSYGAISSSFTTSACAPTVTTQSATSVGQTSATLNGNITATGGANATVRGFAWGTSATMAGDTATTTENGTFGTGAFTNSSLTLVCNTTYYSRAYATNSGGTSYGAISSSFTTTECPGVALNQSNYKFFASSTPGNGSTWTSRTSSGNNNWTSVTYGNGLFVALSDTSGTGNQIMTSPDGVNWTARTSALDAGWKDVTYGNGLFVAVSNGNTNQSVMTSPDGITWTARTTPTTNWWVSVTYGNGKFVAISQSGSGNRVMTSLDGIDWTIQTGIGDRGWKSVTYGNGKFVAVSSDSVLSQQVMYSTDGITWDTASGASDSLWTGVTYGNGKYVAVGQSGTGNRTMYSTDAITWTNGTGAPDNFWWDVVYGNGVFVAVSNAGTINNAVMTSPDGINWTAQTVAVNNQWESITYGNGVFVAASIDGSGNRIMTSGSALGLSQAAENTAAVLSATGDMFKLRQAIVGSNSDANQDTRLFKLQYAEKSGSCDTSFSGETYVDISYDTPIAFTSLFSKINNQNPIVATSTDPTTSLGNIAYQSYVTSDLFSNTYDIAIGDSGLWEFTLKDNGATAGTSYCIRTVKTATSTSASTWTSRDTTGKDNQWLDITYGNGTYVAVANSGTNNRIMSSTDGINWTTRTTSNNNWIRVGYGNGLFIAFSTDGTDMVMTSSDGITWTESSIDGLYYSVAYGNGLFVAVGSNKVSTSLNGTSWTSRTPASDNGWVSVVFGNGLFVAVADSGVGNRVMTSPDGITWTARTHAQSNPWNSVTYGNGLFVAVSSDGTNRVMTSPDGITWSTRNAAEQNSWNKITYGNGLFVAVSLDGTNRVMTSHDGITWSSKSAASANQWYGVTYGNGVYAAVSFDGSNNRVMTASSTDTLLDSYTYIPEIITASQGGSISQLHYRWRNDYGTESGASYAAAEDTAITSGVEVGDRLRLRFLIKDTSGSATNYKYRLETASSSCSAWMQVASSTSANPHWITDTTTRVADGSVTTDSSGLTNPAGTFVPGYVMTQDSQTPALSLTSGQFSELEYSIRSTANISTNTVYCFRLTNAGVTTGFTFSQQPQITILPIGIRRQGGGGGNAGGEANGTGPIIPGGGAGGGGGSTGGSGGGQGTGGGSTGGGGGGDTGYLLLPRFFQLARNLFIITNDEFSFGYILKLR